MSGSRTDVAVIGGGLVGSLVAVFLQQRGLDVTVHERGPDIRSGAAAAGRSINLVLTRRGIHALGQVGLDRGAMELTVPVTGRMIHAVDGALSYQPYGKDDSECNYSISRGGLNRFLVSSAVERGVRIEFDRELVELDLDRGELQFSGPSAAEASKVRADVVVGADGAGSAVRAEMARRPGFEESVDFLEHSYKELTIPLDQAGELELHALHIWPRGDIMLMALPNLDGSFTVTLYLPDRGPLSFESLDTSDRLVAFFRAQFPDALPLIPDLTQDFFDNPTGKLGTVRCRPWNHGGRAVLIGDAAHGIVPFFGQGMNCGFEDCVVLDELLESHGTLDWGRVLEDFGRTRKPDADAIADMALDNFVEMRDRVGDAAFLLRKQVEHRLEQEIPEEYRSRYSMVMYSLIPYNHAREAGKVQEGILHELCHDLTSVDDLDVDLARKLIRRDLAPFMESRSITLDY